MWMTSRSVLRSELACARVRVTLVLVCLLALFSAKRANAQPTELVDLHWTAPPECPRLAEVQARIRKLAGALKPSGTPLRAEAEVTRIDDGKLHLRLLIHAGNLVGERQIDGKSCADLGRATAVDLVLLLNSATPVSQSDLVGPSPSETSPEATRDQGASTAPSTSSSAAPGTTNSPPKSAPIANDASPKATDNANAALRAPRTWRVLVQLPVFAFGIGPLRAPSAGLAAAGGVAFDGWRFLAKGTAWAAQHASVTSDLEAYGGDIHRLSGELLACRALLGARFEVAPCALLSLEHVSASGTGTYIAPRPTATTWLALGLGVQARLALTSWLSVHVGVEAELETVHPELVLGGVGSLERLLPVAATGTVGPEWIF
jgi:hypothetical protein